MNELNIKKVEVEEYPAITGFGMDNDDIIIRFRSGSTFRFSGNGIKTGIEQVFSGAVDFGNKPLRTALLDSVNRTIMKNEAGDRYVRKLGRVSVIVDELRDEWFDAYSKIWDETVELAKAPVSSDGDIAEPRAMKEIFDRMSVPYTPDIAGLDVSNVRRVQRVDTGIEEYPVAYFYTTGETHNGSETWRKAIDPMCFFGEPIGFRAE